MEYNVEYLILFMLTLNCSQNNMHASSLAPNSSFFHFELNW